MKLPNRENVLIPKNKLVNYLLSEAHPLGRFKAKLFRSFGFSMTNVDLLEKSLRDIAKSNEVIETESSEYGTKYVIDGEIEAPNRKAIKLRNVWLIEKGGKRPRFVTAYPV